MNFWPDEINVDEVRSPHDIMKEAGDELESRASRLDVRIASKKLDDRVVWSFEVSHPAAGLTLRLFEASHQLDQTYPVVIAPPSSDIPEFLRRKRYVPGQPGSFSGLKAFRALAEGAAGHVVTNEWVCGSPSEFEKKLQILFSEDRVKSRIISILAPTVIGGAENEAESSNPGNSEADEADQN